MSPARKLAALLAAAESVLVTYEKALEYLRTQATDARHPMAYGALSSFMPELKAAVEAARPKPTRRVLTPEQRLKVRSLMVDEGESRAAAVAWVTQLEGGH